MLFFRHAKIICAFACIIQNECLSLQCLNNDSKLSRRASVIAQRFRLGIFYAHKDIGGCHLVQFIKALRVETSLFKQRDVQPLLCVSATAVPWMLKQ